MERAHTKVSVVIPVYNEAPAIAELLRCVCKAALPDWCEMEVVVVDDGSTDHTMATIGEFIEEHSEYADRIKVHESLINHGKGAALRAGFKIAKGDIILVQDGDLEYSPSDYANLLEPFRDPDVHVVYGSRFLRGRAERHEASAIWWRTWCCRRPRRSCTANASPTRRPATRSSAAVCSITSSSPAGASSSAPSSPETRSRPAFASTRSRSATSRAASSRARRSRRWTASQAIRWLFKIWFRETFGARRVARPERRPGTALMALLDEPRLRGVAPGHPELLRDPAADHP